MAFAKSHYRGEREMVIRAKAIRFQAERRLGEILKAMPKATGSAGTGRPTLGGNKLLPPKSDAPTLADIGITKMMSSRAQRLAEIKPPVFERLCAGEITLPRALKQTPARGPVDPDALARLIPTR